MKADKENLELISMLDDGKTREEVALHFGITDHKLRAWISRLGKQPRYCSAVRPHIWKPGTPRPGQQKLAQQKEKPAPETSDLQTSLYGDNGPVQKIHERTIELLRDGTFGSYIDEFLTRYDQTFDGDIAELAGKLNAQVRKEFPAKKIHAFVEPSQLQIKERYKQMVPNGDQEGNDTLTEATQLCRAANKRNLARFALMFSGYCSKPMDTADFMDEMEQHPDNPQFNPLERMIRNNSQSGKLPSALTFDYKWRKFLHLFGNAMVENNHRILADDLRLFQELKKLNKPYRGKERTAGKIEAEQKGKTDDSVGLNRRLGNRVMDHYYAKERGTYPPTIIWNHYREYIGKRYGKNLDKPTAQKYWLAEHGIGKYPIGYGPAAIAEPKVTEERR